MSAAVRLTEPRCSRFRPKHFDRNLGNRLARWFEEQFGSTQCQAITGCDFSTSNGVRAYIERDHVNRCIDIAARVAGQVRDIVNAAASGGTSEAGREA